MSKRVLVGEAEYLTPVDYERFGLFPRDAMDDVVGDAVGYPRHWSAFTVARKSAQEVSVSPGRLLEGRIVYEAEATQTLNLTAYIPLAASDERWVALILRGQTVSLQENRAFETSQDPENSEPVAIPAPVIEARTLGVVVQQGNAAPSPAIKPDIAETDSCIAFVRLTTQGVQEIEPGQKWRAKTLFEVEGRVTSLEVRIDLAFQQIETLQTDLANLQGRLSDIPRQEVIRQLQRDASQTRRRLNLPDEARAYFYDAGLVKDQWDIAHPSWLARVAEGIRFANAAERDSQLSVINPAATDIRIERDVLMPAWTETKRIEVDGTGSFRNISQQVHTVKTAVQRTRSRSAVRYGPTVAMCDNVADWAQIGTAREGQTFQVKGETFEKIGTIDAVYTNTNVNTSVFNAVHGVNYGINDLVLHNSLLSSTGHRAVYAARSVQVDTWTESYWDYVTETFGINGSVYGQTFLVTHPLVLTSMELKFSRVGSDGNVTLILCEVDATGVPLFDRVIERSTVEAKDLKTGWVRFPFTPAFIPAGRRYAWVTVTSGNHALAVVTGSKFTQGTLFWSTDQAWFQGSPEDDFCFRVNGAQFTTNRAVIEFTPLTLENGMTEIALIYANWAPEGTSMMWEVMPSGSDKWLSIQPETNEAPNPLVGLPPLTRLRLTMIGTTDLAPAIILDAKARALTSRPRGDAVGVSKVLTFGFATTAIQVEVTVDQFDDELHDVDPKVIVGSTVYTPATVSTSLDLSKATRRTVTATFNVPSTTNARLRLDMDTTTPVRVPFVERVSLFAL